MPSFSRASAYYVLPNIWLYPPNEMYYFGMRQDLRKKKAEMLLTIELTSAKFLNKNFTGHKQVLVKNLKSKTYFKCIYFFWKQHTIRKVKFLSKNSILTKPQHFYGFFIPNFFDNFSREIKVVNS